MRPAKSTSQNSAMCASPLIICEPKATRLRAADLHKNGPPRVGAYAPELQRRSALGRRAEVRATLLYVPVPLKGIRTLAAPCWTTNSPVRAALAVGLKVTVTVQLAWGARLVPHCESRWKSVPFVPFVANPKGLTKLAATVPVLVTVTGCGLLLEPTVT